jgi:hypothetical protein
MAREEMRLMPFWNAPREYQQRRREEMVAGLLTPDCAECPARSGAWCDPMYPPPAELVRVDRDPPHVVHSTRLAAAVDSGHVPRSLLIAQFAGGQLPSGLTVKTRNAR